MKRKYLIAIVLIVVIASSIAIWYKFYRDVPQPNWIGADPRSVFLYGAVDAKETQGIPYWIWLALPRMFPEYMPGPGGYASLGLSWEETLEMPVGFAKKTVGYVRVTGNCALCHATSAAAGEDGVRNVIIPAPARVTNIQPLLTFFGQCAKDSRFNADEILTEVANATKLSFVDKFIYRYILIPRTKKALADPAAVIFAPALQTHRGNPQAGFSEQEMRSLEAWLKSQH
jgi:hypothetical protein